MEKKKLLLPVTDWARVPEGATLWRDQYTFEYEGLTKVGYHKIRCINVPELSDLYPQNHVITFLMEVEPVVEFVGVAMYVPGEESDMEITCDKSAGYTLYDRTTLGEVEPGKKYKVTVQEVEGWETLKGSGLDKPFKGQGNG